MKVRAFLQWSYSNSLTYWAIFWSSVQTWQSHYLLNYQPLNSETPPKLTQNFLHFLMNFIHIKFRQAFSFFLTNSWLPLFSYMPAFWTILLDAQAQTVSFLSNTFSFFSQPKFSKVSFPLQLMLSTWLMRFEWFWRLLWHCVISIFAPFFSCSKRRNSELDFWACEHSWISLLSSCCESPLRLWPFSPHHHLGPRFIDPHYCLPNQSVFLSSPRNF